MDPRNPDFGVLEETLLNQNVENLVFELLTTEPWLVQSNQSEDPSNNENFASQREFVFADNGMPLSFAELTAVTWKLKKHSNGSLNDREVITSQAYARRIAKSDRYVFSDSGICLSSKEFKNVTWDDERHTQGKFSDGREVIPKNEYKIRLEKNKSNFVFAESGTALLISQLDQVVWSDKEKTKGKFIDGSDVITAQAHGFLRYLNFKNRNRTGYKKSSQLSLKKLNPNANSVKVNSNFVFGDDGVHLSIDDQSNVTWHNEKKTKGAFLNREVVTEATYKQRERRKRKSELSENNKVYVERPENGSLSNDLIGITLNPPKRVNTNRMSDLTSGLHQANKPDVINDANEVNQILGMPMVLLANILQSPEMVDVNKNDIQENEGASPNQIATTPYRRLNLFANSVNHEDNFQIQIENKYK